MNPKFMNLGFRERNGFLRFRNSGSNVWVMMLHEHTSLATRDTPHACLIDRDRACGHGAGSWDGPNGTRDAQSMLGHEPSPSRSAGARDGCARILRGGCPVACAKPRRTSDNLPCDGRRCGPPLPLPLQRGACGVLLGYTSCNATRRRHSPRAQSHSCLPALPFAVAFSQRAHKCRPCKRRPHVLPSQSSST